MDKVNIDSIIEIWEKRQKIAAYVDESIDEIIAELQSQFQKKKLNYNVKKSNNPNGYTILFNMFQVNFTYEDIARNTAVQVTKEHIRRLVEDVIYNRLNPKRT